MSNPSPLSRRIDALPDTLCRLMSDPAVSESLARADESKRRLAGLLPLDGVEQSAIDEYRKDWLARYVYNSNAIEGSTLSPKDTELVLEGGFLPARAPARYIFAARGVADGMAYVKRFVDRKHPLDIDVIRKLHEITALDMQPALRGDFRPYGYLARIRGAAVKTSDPLEIWDDLEALLAAADGGDAHPILRAAGFHAMFENIHPFADGNGRTGRQILNMMLMQAGYKPIAIKHDAGRTYAEQLEQWQANDNPAPLTCMVANCVVQEQDRIGGIVSGIRRGHGSTSAPGPYTPLPMPDPAVKTTEPTAPEQGLGML
ncbi:Fic family protein [uncultured Bifidobacterium sp.]|uniref:Fic family protein n=1 Tax=uncultured Bifidobacterium sp. TaxID=165187 RepID=UPI00261D43F5|nr:Fic family protein [uncultured Bifidobacterium sp.]